MRNRVAVLSCVAGLSLGFSSCGGETVSADEYMGSFCTALDGFAQTATEAQTAMQSAVTSGDATAGKEEIVSFLDQASSDLDDAVSDLEDAGTPDIENGDEVADTLVAALQGFAGAFEDAAGAAEDLPTDSLESLQSGAEAIQTDIQESIGQIEESVGEIDDDPELVAAYESNPECQTLQGLGDTP